MPLQIINNNKISPSAPTPELIRSYREFPYKITLNK
nr:MAG TPA: hypothetical protein [Caudoviricetes sp.]